MWRWNCNSLFTNRRQDDWVGLLPFTEFQYNNQVHSSTQHPPFLLDTGHIPQMGFELDQPRSHVESINEFRDRMNDTLEEAKAALAKSKDNMMLYYNWKWSLALEFKAGNMVFLDASDIQTTWPSRKPFHWRLGPFPIDSQVGNSVYHLRLPPSMGRFCHGPCSVTFFPKNIQRTALTESPMMANSPLFSATITTFC